MTLEHAARRERGTEACSRTARWAAQQLRDLYGEPRLGNKKDALAELVFIALSRQTHEKNYTRAWRDLRQRFPTWASLAEAEPDCVYATIRASGFARQKATWIQGALFRVRKEFGSYSLRRLADFSTEDAEKFLCSLPGVNTKSAKCVLMYSLSREVLPVDTHVQRISERLGLVTVGLPSRTAHSRLEALVPAHLRYAFHVGCVLHGRKTCTARNPQCTSCPLRRRCPSVRSDRGKE